MAKEDLREFPFLEDTYSAQEMAHTHGAAPTSIVEFESRYGKVVYLYR